MIRVSSDDEITASLLPDLTPLLDVVFIVLVFLLFTANSVPLTLPVDLPETEKAVARQLDKPDAIGVNLLQGASAWALEGEEFSSWEAFSKALQQKVQAEPERAVVIAGDRQVPMEKLVQLMQFLQQNNIAAAQILMKEK
ncbi:ExbD/TolR family protein [Endozoicomonadaceae bacterium StTr2]